MYTQKGGIIPPSAREKKILLFSPQFFNEKTQKQIFFTFQSYRLTAENFGRSRRYFMKDRIFKISHKKLPSREKLEEIQVEHRIFM